MTRGVSKVKRKGGGCRDRMRERRGKESGNEGRKNQQESRCGGRRKGKMVRNEARRDVQNNKEEVKEKKVERERKHG